MLVATLRLDNPLGEAALACDNGGETLMLVGVGEITAARLLDLENRRQLVWVDGACRERVLGTVIARIRGEAANRAVARAEAAAAALAAMHGTGGGARGTPAAPTKFEAPGEIAHQGRRVVWTEPAVAESRPRQTAGEAPLRPRRLWAWAIVSLACVAAVALGLLFPHQIAHQLALSSARQATPYTGLYSTDPETLPTRLRVFGPNPFSFTVVDHEGRERVFAYIVTQGGPHWTSIVEQGTVDLKDNTGAERVVNVVPTSRHADFLITVTIADPLQTIHFKAYS